MGNDFVVRGEEFTVVEKYFSQVNNDVFLPGKESCDHNAY